MSVKPKILFLTEAGSGIGMGHLSRCTALADGFLSQNCKVKLVARGISKHQIKYNNWTIDHEEWLNLNYIDLTSSVFDIIVVDSYVADKQTLKYLALNVRNPIFIIDSKMNFYPKGMVLFPSIYGNKVDIPASDQMILMAGKDYLLFSSIFWNFPNYKINHEVRSLGISIGSEFSDTFIDSIISIVETLYDKIEIKIFGCESGLRIKKNNIKTLGFLPKSQYINEVLSTDLMIVNGGQSLNECILLGVPSISIVMADNQLRNALTWESYNLTKHISNADLNFDKMLMDYLTLYINPELRKGISVRSNQLITPFGSIKAAKEILHHMKRLS